MKRIAALVLGAAAILMSAGSAMAQRHAVEVNVPFSFTVNDVTLSAGTYTVGSDLAHPNTLVIRDRAGRVMATETGNIDHAAASSAGKLVFHHYGEQYFLSEIRLSSPETALVLTPARLERQARKHSRRESSYAVATS